MKAIDVYDALAINYEPAILTEIVRRLHASVQPLPLSFRFE
jgi:hypothetical protein